MDDRNKTNNFITHAKDNAPLMKCSKNTAGMGNPGENAGIFSTKMRNYKN